MDLGMTPDLAEVCGIHAGDGYLRNDGKRRELDISGGFDEKEYYDNHVIPLFERVFNIKIKPRFFPYRSTYGFVIRDPKIIKFMHSLGFPYGKKTLTVGVPEQILKSKNLDVIYRFIRGLFDTDGSLCFRKRIGSGYKKVHLVRNTLPSIALGVCSKTLWSGVSKLLIKTGFQFTASTRKPKNNDNLQYQIELRGDASLISWLINIGFKNPTKYTRFLIWKKFGFMPPGLNYKEQKRVLTGKTNPNSYYPDKTPKDTTFVIVSVKKRLKRIQDFGITLPKN